MIGRRSTRTPRWVEPALKEYEAHRAEVLAESAAQQQILALGATAVGVVAAGAFNVWEDRLLATVAFLGAIPLLCLFVLVQWAGRAGTTMRVGVYLGQLEKALRIYSRAPFPVLRWEATLVHLRRDKAWRPQPGWNDLGAVGVFAALAAGSIALGAYRGWAGREWLIAVLTAVQSLIVCVSVVAIGVGVATARTEARRMFRR